MAVSGMTHEAFIERNNNPVYGCLLIHYSDIFPDVNFTEIYSQIFPKNLFLNNMSGLGQIIAWRLTGDKPLSELMMA